MAEGGTTCARRLSEARSGYKRAFDLTLLTVAGVLLAPLWVATAVGIAVVVRAYDGGPVLYRQRRLGYRGQPFELVKFRTMPVDAEAETGAVWPNEADVRATPPGRWLRRLRLDELPQAVNVLRGEMSLVGPRPERPEMLGFCERTAPGYRRRLEVRPGIAGLAQARRGAAAWPRQKLRYDLLYIRAMSPRLDIRLCFACLARVWREARPPPGCALGGQPTARPGKGRPGNKRGEG